LYRKDIFNAKFTFFVFLINVVETLVSITQKKLMFI